MQPHSTPPTSPTLFNILWHNDNLFGCYLCFSKDGFNFNRAIIASMSGGENSIVTLYFATQKSDRGKGKSEGWGCASSFCFGCCSISDGG